jgi:hypothetical protein
MPVGLFFLCQYRVSVVGVAADEGELAGPPAPTFPQGIRRRVDAGRRERHFGPKGRQ